MTRVNTRAMLGGSVASLGARDLLPPDCLAVLCVGSVARGWDNEQSDYDFVIVSRSQFAAPPGSQLVSVPLIPDITPTVAIHVEGRRWEIKYWVDEHFDQMLAKVDWSIFDGASFSRILVEAEEITLERLSSCIPLLGADWAAKRRGEVAQSAFRASVVTRSLAGLDSAVEDALGQSAAGDLYSATLSARRAIGHVVDALLDSRGCYGSLQPKWRARRFRSALPPELTFDDYWAMETMRDFDPDAPQKWIDNVLALCAQLAMEVEVA